MNFKQNIAILWRFMLSDSAKKKNHFVEQLDNAVYCLCLFGLSPLLFTCFMSFFFSLAINHDIWLILYCLLAFDNFFDDEKESTCLSRNACTIACLD